MTSGTCWGMSLPYGGRADTEGRQRLNLATRLQPCDGLRDGDEHRGGTESGDHGLASLGPAVTWPEGTMAAKTQAHQGPTVPCQSR